MANTTGQKFGGRQPGTPNRLTSEIREMLKSALQNEIDLIEVHLMSLEPKERLEILVKLLPFILPKADIESLKGNLDQIFVTLDLN